MLRVIFPTFLICIYLSTLTHPCCIPNLSCGLWLYHPNTFEEEKLWMEKPWTTQLLKWWALSSVTRVLFLVVVGLVSLPYLAPLKVGSVAHADIHWSLWALSVWVKQTDVKLAMHLHLVNLLSALLLWICTRLGRRNNDLKFCTLYVFANCRFVFQIVTEVLCVWSQASNAGTLHLRTDLLLLWHSLLLV